MQGEKKKAKSRGSKGEKGRLGPGRPDRPDRIDEYNFFLAQGEALVEDVAEGKAIKKKWDDRNNSMTFFLSE